MVDVNKNRSAAPRVLVAQHGGRHRYAIPRMLEQEGMLSGFYTDTSASSLYGRAMGTVGRVVPSKGMHSARFEEISVPAAKVRSTDRPYVQETLQKFSGGRPEGMRLFMQRHAILSGAMKRWGVRDANMTYTMFHEGLDFVRYAKSKGLISVVDVYISPITDRIMAEESKAFPAWAQQSNEEDVRLERELWEQTAALADVLLCPSEWVADGVRDVSPGAASKIRVVPYGCSMNYAGETSEPVPGRILFAGREALRKGLHYLGEAATRLKEELPHLDIRIAGTLPEEVRAHPVCRDLNFLGHLGRDEIKREFLTADALALPALSEGFAAVVAEAIGAGCPVVVTREAGSPVVDGREGLVVPARDADALAGALKRIVEDRALRSRCSAACLEQAGYYSVESWKNRLVDVLEQELTAHEREPERKMD